MHIRLHSRNYSHFGLKHEMKAYRVFVHGQKLIWSKFEIGLTSLTQSLHVEFEIMRHSEFAFFKRSSWHNVWLENVRLNDKFSQQKYEKCSHRYKKMLGECLFTGLFELCWFISFCFLWSSGWFALWYQKLKNSVDQLCPELEEEIKKVFGRNATKLKMLVTIAIWFNPPPTAKLKIYLKTVELCKIWWGKNSCGE